MLVGMMGSGKSTVARMLGERLGRQVLDTDQMIEQRTGRTVREIFAGDGEDEFRRLESGVLDEALRTDAPSVIAAAGGVVTQERNRTMLRESDARVVWLSADPATLAERVGAAPHRPLLDADPEGALRRLAEQRDGWYREVADLIVRVDGRSVHDVVEAILR